MHLGTGIELTDSASEEDIVLSHSQSLKWIIPITIIYSIIFIAGFVGNISICIVIASNKSMHTVMNYYLFNLAVSDLSLLIFGLLPELFYDWTSYKYFPSKIACVVQCFVFEMAIHTALLTIIAFTVDRYLAICYPFVSLTTLKISRVVKFITAVWILAILLAIPNIFRICLNCQIRSYNVVVEADQMLSNFLKFRSPIMFAVSVILITVLYILICMRLRNTMEIMSSRSALEHKYTIRILVAIVILFCLCWAPFHAERIVRIYFLHIENTDTDYYEQRSSIYDVIFHLSGILFYLSTTVNPLVYSVMSKKFRDAFKETFIKRQKCFYTHPS